MVDHPHIKHRGRKADPLYRIRKLLLADLFLSSR